MTEDGLSPEPSVVSATCRDTELPVFVTLRLNDSWTTTGGELTRLVGLAEDYLSCGASGVAFGFLDADLEVDTEVCEHLATSLPHVPWTFHDAVDASLDPLLQYDAITGVDLFVDGAWVAVANPPCTVAAPCDGSFPGYTLTADEREAATSVRLVYTESPSRTESPTESPTSSPSVEVPRVSSSLPRRPAAPRS